MNTYTFHYRSTSSSLLMVTCNDLNLKFGVEATYESKGTTTAGELIIEAPSAEKLEEVKAFIRQHKVYGRHFTESQTAST